MAGQANFKIGDLVQLKAGGPVMAVQSVPSGTHNPYYRCQWFAGKKLEAGQFPGDSLQAAPKEE